MLLINRFLCIFIIPADVFSLLQSDKANAVHQVLDYKYSFKPPHITRPDGTIPFWEKFGNAIAGGDNIRVAPSLRSQRGSIWCKNKTNFDWWEVEVVFRISGRGRIGADGMAFWYVEEKNFDNSVFGGPDSWKGLGIFFDSFDNDDQHNNPHIMAMTNDGTKQYDHHGDGFAQKAAGCFKDYRNTPFPVRVKIRYHNNVLTLNINNGMSKENIDKEYHLCFRGEDVHLAKNGYFGISAATGGLADDHDVMKFLTSRIDETFHATPETAGLVDHEKYDQEYLGYQQNVEKQKIAYKEEHPDAVFKKQETDEESVDDYLYDEEHIKAVNNIFQEQTRILTFTDTISNQIEDIMAHQKNIQVALSTYTSSQGAGGVKIGSVVTTPIANPDGLQRYEVENILASNAELLTTVGQIKEMLKLMTGNSPKPPPGEIPGITPEDPSKSLETMGFSIVVIRTEIYDLGDKVIANYKKAAFHPCPVMICISTKAYVGFSLITTAIVIGYMVYKEYSEVPVKKFY